MLDISLQHLAKLIGIGYRGNSGIFAQRVTIDSRQVKKGDLFFALKGENVDGHQFIEQAFKKGAVGAVVSDFKKISYYKDKAFLLSPDPVKTLQDLAKLIRQNFFGKVVAITGSTGKTSTKDLLFSVLKQKNCVLKSRGNFNNELGLPLTICALDNSHETLILEMGMRGLNQIDFLCKIAQPNLGIITNIGNTHAELLGSREKIAQAKAELLKFIPPEGFVFLPQQDQSLLEPYLKDCKGQVYWFGTDGQCDIKLKDIISTDEKGSRFKVGFNNQVEEFYLPIPGMYNILNSLPVIGLSYLLGIEGSLIKKGLAEVQLTSQRMEIMHTKEGVKLLNDTYNANPASMEAAINFLASYKNKRKIAVLGDMLELGKYEIESHKDIGAHAFSKEINFLIVVGKRGKIIGEGALETGMDKKKIFFAKDNNEVIKFLEQYLQNEDVVLVKGSRGMKMEEIVEAFMR